MTDISPAHSSLAIARLRSELGATQASVAEKAGLDQSRVSRIEKGEVAATPEVDRVLDALVSLGSSEAAAYKAYVARAWSHIEPPGFWNPQRAGLEIADETLQEIESFLDDDSRPWPLRRQIERHQGSLFKAATYLTKVNHNVAFIGDMGVGKSTAISFLFELLVPPSLAEKQINRPILETGAGGTTVCEVHVKSGPQFGISLVPLSDAELHELISDFCAAKWSVMTKEQKGGEESVNVSHEIDRAIRNMSGLVRRRTTVDGKTVYHDPIQDLVKASSSEESFRIQVVGLMSLANRTQRELWYDSSTRKHPMEWITETFKAVNNGRLAEVSLPRSIDLIMPSFGQSFGEFDITVIDTKGVDDVAIREDLESRLKDSRTAVVFCSRFNDAPGTSARVLLQHMQKTFSERVDTGKVSILALPRAGEARAMKDDVGEQALTDAEGYEFKSIQVSSDLAADDLAGVPMIFFNVESDDAKIIRAALLGQLGRMRKTIEERLFDLCAATHEIIRNHEAQAITAAIEEVANRLNTFLRGNRRLGARERLAHVEAISTIKGIRYASTLWASTRRKGEYSGLNIIHQIGVGAARDAHSRCDHWFAGLDAFLRALAADDGLALARKTISQIGASATASKRVFLEAAQQAGIEVYREPLAQARVWSDCAAEWGQGAGFKMRVAAHLEKWFAANPEPKESLEVIVSDMWDKLVIAPLEELAQDSAPDDRKIVEFRKRNSA